MLRQEGAAEQAIPAWEWGAVQGDPGLLKYPETAREEWMTRRVRERMIFYELLRISLARAMDDKLMHEALAAHDPAAPAWDSAKGAGQVIRQCAIREERRVGREAQLCVEISTVAFESFDEGEVLAAYWGALEAISRTAASAPQRSQAAGPSRGAPRRRPSQNARAYAVGLRAPAPKSRPVPTAASQQGRAYLTALPFDGTDGAQARGTPGPSFASAANEGIARPLSAHTRPGHVQAARKVLVQEHAATDQAHARAAASASAPEDASARVRRAVHAAMDRARAFSNAPRAEAPATPLSPRAAAGREAADRPMPGVAPAAAREVWRTEDTPTLEGSDPRDDGEDFDGDLLPPIASMSPRQGPRSRAPSTSLFAEPPPVEEDTGGGKAVAESSSGNLVSGDAVRSSISAVVGLRPDTVAEAASGAARALYGDLLQRLNRGLLPGKLARRGRGPGATRARPAKDLFGAAAGTASWADGAGQGAFERELLRTALSMRTTLQSHLVDEGVEAGRSILLAHIAEQQARFREDMDACCVSLGLSPERVATVDGLWEMARLAEASQASPRPAEAAHANGHTRTVPAAAHHRPRGALGGFMFGYLGMTREDLVRAHRLLQGRAARVIQRRAREFLARVRVQRALVQAERAQKDRVAVQVQAAVRAWLARRQTVLLRLRRSVAAAVIQRAVRRWLLRRPELEQRRAIKEQAKVDCEEFIAFLRYNTSRVEQWSRLDPARHRAAVMMQSVWKGHQVRKAVARMRPAAVCIQRHFRGWHVRRAGGALAQQQRLAQFRRQRELGALFAQHRDRVAAGFAVSRAIARTWAEAQEERAALDDLAERSRAKIEERWRQFYDAVVQEAMKIPLPRGWMPQLDARNSRIVYVNVREARMTEVHPCMAPAMDHLARQRQLAVEELQRSQETLLLQKEALAAAHQQRQAELAALLARKRGAVGIR